MLHEFDKDVPIYQVRTMDEVLAASVARQRVSMVVLIVFGGVAALLAMVGLYGLIAHAVAERTPEIGLRMALGASQMHVLGLFLRQGLIATACGLVLGTAVALNLTRWLESLLFGVTATDVPTFAAVSVVLLIVAGAACYIPARRASRVDPAVTIVARG